MGPFGAKGEKGERSPIIPSLQDVEQVSADVQNGPSPAVGLSVGMAAVFLFSEMVGGGILTLPKAIENTGIPGMVYLAITASIMAFTGTLIGLTWRLVQERFPQYRGHVRYPYPAIGQVTYGRPGRVLISICLGAGLYGSSVVAFMLVVNNTGQMLTDMGHPVEFHGRSAVVAAVILPLMWFGTPKDFWPVGIVAMLTAFVSGMLIIASIFYDAAQNTGGAVEHVVPEFIDVTMAFGTVCYAFAGHVMFPTIQTDMKEANKFTYSVLAAMAGLVLVQCTISIAAYFVYGSDITDNILFAISGGTMRYVVQGLMTIHYLLAIIILINPVSQEIEDILNIPKEFNWKRCISRTILLGSILIITMIIPNFQLFLALVGGSTMFTTAIICPPLFHYKLCSLEGDWEKIYLSLGRRVLYAFIVVFGAISGLLCTFSTTYTLVVTARRHSNNVTSTAEI